MKKLIYISHKYGADENNKLSAEKQIEKMAQDERLFKDCCFVSPIHCFGFMYETVDYDTGLQYCLDLLENCVGMLVLGEHETSKGVKAEKQYCLDHSIPFLEVSDLEKDYVDEVVTWVESLTS